MRHRAPGWAAARGVHRGGGSCITSLRQRVAVTVVYHGIAQPGRVAPPRQRGESSKAVGTACRHYDSGSYIMASRRRAGRSAWRASRQWVLPSIATTAGRTSRRRAAGWVAARGECRGSGNRMSSHGTHSWGARRPRCRRGAGEDGKLGHALALKDLEDGGRTEDGGGKRTLLLFVWCTRHREMVGFLRRAGSGRVGAADRLARAQGM